MNLHNFHKQKASTPQEQLVTFFVNVFIRPSPPSTVRNQVFQAGKN